MAGWLAAEGASAGFSLADGLALLNLRASELWWRYAAYGGKASVAELADRIAGNESIDAYEHDLIAHAMNEEFDELGMTEYPVGYTGVPLPASAVELLEGGRSAELAQHTAGQVTTLHRQARAARHRSVSAHARACLLQTAAAELMQSSGQIQFAARAHQRAGQARRRLVRALRAELPTTWPPDQLG